MRIAINATNIVIGGGIQVASNFINYCVDKKDDHEFLFLVSKHVFNNLTENSKQDSRIKIFNDSPSKILKRPLLRNQILKKIKAFDANIVFTVFGPSYIKFKITHLSGFADGWVTHPNKLALGTLNRFERLKYKFVNLYKIKYLYKSDFYWVEAPLVKKGLIQKVKIDSKNIRIIPNSYSHLYIGKRKIKKNTNIVITTISSPYPHKNLSIIPKVAKLVNNYFKGKKIRFIVTLPNYGKEVDKFWDIAKKYDSKKYITNVGLVTTEQCIRLYNLTDLIFLPTLLESYSASYPEAMYMKKPIVTTDLSFARDICGNSAIYYRPLSASDAMKKILSILKDKELYNKLVSNGTKRLKSFIRPNEKYELIFNYIKDLT